MLQLPLGQARVANKLKGDLLLDSREGRQRTVMPGKPAESLMVKAVRHVEPQLKMPPGGKLSTAAIADLEAWIEMGAEPNY